MTFTIMTLLIQALVHFWASTQFIESVGTNSGTGLPSTLSHTQTLDRWHAYTQSKMYQNIYIYIHVAMRKHTFIYTCHMWTDMNVYSVICIRASILSLSIASQEQ